MIQSQYFKSVMDSIWSLSCAVDPQAALAQVARTMSILINMRLSKQGIPKLQRTTCYHTCQKTLTN